LERQLSPISLDTPFSTVTNTSVWKLPDHSSEKVIQCINVDKEFYVYQHRTTSLREWFIRTLMRKPLYVRRASFTLQDFNLEIKKGEGVALIGSNGAGKSTALRLIAGIYKPSAVVLKL